MTAVKRFYIIENKDTETIRGWRAHRYHTSKIRRF